MAHKNQVHDLTMSRGQTLVQRRAWIKQSRHRLRQKKDYARRMTIARTRPVVCDLGHHVALSDTALWGRTVRTYRSIHLAYFGPPHLDHLA